jgi:hypothetical protein
MELHLTNKFIFVRAKHRLITIQKIFLFVAVLLFLGCINKIAQKQEGVLRGPELKVYSLEEQYKSSVDSFMQIEKRINSRLHGINDDFDISYLQVDAWYRFKEYIGLKFIDDSLLIYYAFDKGYRKQNELKEYSFKVTTNDIKNDIDSLMQFDTLKSIRFVKPYIKTKPPTYTFEEAEIDGNSLWIRFKNNYVDYPRDDTKSYWNSFPYYIYLDRIRSYVNNVITKNNK